jgi:branched-chain amino acid aminotransferase
VNVSTADLIWMDGEIVAWEDAKVHVLTHALHYGTSVFEGIRAYETERGPAVFRHDDHLDRLEASAKLFYMDVPFAKEELRAATHELISRNGFKSCYIRPLVFRGHGPMGLDPESNPVQAIVAVWEWGAYLGEEAQRNGVRAKVSSWRRISPGSLIPHAKAGGQYLNSVLAKIESKRGGYEEAILLDDKGNVCEGSGENVFVVKRGEIATPPQSASILDGISRRSIMEIAADLGYPVVERDIARAELALADEVFLVGTAAELTPMREIDDIEIGPPGELTREIQRVYDDALHGRDPRYEKWLDIVPVASKA